MLGCVPAVVDPYLMRCSLFLGELFHFFFLNWQGDGKSDLPKQVVDVGL